MNTTNHEIMLLRHGKAEKDFHGSDFERELTETGHEQTLTIASYMREQLLIPDKIISSSAKRAVATADIICDVLAIGSDSIETRADLYEAEWSDVLKLLQQLPESVTRLLLVGHNPTFEYLAECLVKNTMEGIHLSPSSMARIKLNNQWINLSIGQCELISITHAQDLVLINKV